jgi:hypothetical protein
MWCEMLLGYRRRPFATPPTHRSSSVTQGLMCGNLKSFNFEPLLHLSDGRSLRVLGRSPAPYACLLGHSVGIQPRYRAGPRKPPARVRPWLGHRRPAAFWKRQGPQARLGAGSGVATCGAPNKSAGRCRRKVVAGTSRCPVHEGSWPVYGVAQRKEKKRRIRNKC